MWLSGTCGDGHRCSDGGVCFVDLSDEDTRLVVMVMLVIVAIVEIVAIGSGGVVALILTEVVVI